MKGRPWNDIGYARVSTQDQNLDLQIDALRTYGVDRIFKEKLTGTKRERPQLDEMITYLRPGDTVVVWKLGRIGRSTKHLVDLVNEFGDKGINFVSLKDSIDTSTATGKLVFTIFAGLAEFERDMIGTDQLSKFPFSYDGVHVNVPHVLDSRLQEMNSSKSRNTSLCRCHGISL